MPGFRRPLVKVACERCGRVKYSILKNRNLCSRCHHKEKSISCDRCGQPFHPLSAGAALCARCVRIRARPAVRARVICPRCKQLRLPPRLCGALCRRCLDLEHHGLANCARCGRFGAIRVIGQRLCHRCWSFRRHGYASCCACHRYKPVYVKSQGICKACYHDSLAATSIERYVARYACRFSFSRELFLRLVQSTDPKRVREVHRRRLYYFGNFLQQHELKSPLTWEQIYSVMPALPPTRRNVPKAIRACLLALGELCAEQGEMESYQTYLARRASLAPIADAPRGIQPDLRAFADWMASRQMRPASIHHHLEALARFWRWCGGRGVTRAREVHAALVDDYLLGLYGSWACGRCGTKMSGSDIAPTLRSRCPRCHAQALRKKKGFALNTVRRRRASLFVFFEWTRVTRRVVHNPVQRKIPAPEPRIQHYPAEILRPIAQYISAADSDATSAFMLYLIVFNLATVQELRLLRLPEPVNLITKHATTESLTPVLILPRRQASLGVAHPGRPGGCIKLYGLDRRWLARLLSRFLAERAAALGSRSKTRYVFVSRGARYDHPVCPVWVWARVKRATRAILGSPCSPNTLRKTAAIYFADRVGAGILGSLGLEAQQAFAYTWTTRELLHPAARH